LKGGTSVLLFLPFSHCFAGSGIPLVSDKGGISTQLFLPYSIASSVGHNLYVQSLCGNLL
jgi:hypothetical protein